MFDYLSVFEDALSGLKREQRYRVFIELEREAGRLPHALWNSPTGKRMSSSGVRTTTSAWGSTRW
jgi:5-aminolevulinate synthase